MPGHGKSTLLNYLADPTGATQPFKTSSGLHSCTKEVGEFTVRVGGCTVTLVDTMGFPDTDEKVAASMYDKVVLACNKPLNLLLWVVKQERGDADLMAKYKDLFHEFNNIKAPILMFINNHGNFAGPRQALKSEAFASGKAFGLHVQRETGVVATAMFVSAELQDFELARQMIGRCLASTWPVPSTMRTYQSCAQEAARCATARQRMDVELQQAERRLQKATEATQWYATARNVTLGVGGAMTAAMVMFPPLGAAAAASTAALTEAFEQDRRSAAAREAEERTSLQELRSNHTLLADRATRATARHVAMRKALERK